MDVWNKDILILGMRRVTYPVAISKLFVLLKSIMQLQWSTKKRELDPIQLLGTNILFKQELGDQ